MWDSVFKKCGFRRIGFWILTILNNNFSIEYFMKWIMTAQSFWSRWVYSQDFCIKFLNLLEIVVFVLTAFLCKKLKLHDTHAKTKPYDNIYSYLKKFRFKVLFRLISYSEFGDILVILPLMGQPKYSWQWVSTTK